MGELPGDRAWQPNHLSGDDGDRLEADVIPDEALLKLNVRTFDAQVRTRVLEAIERIVEAEATASGAPRPPEITITEQYPLTVNDPDRTARVAAAFRGQFGADRVHELASPYFASGG